MPEAGPPAVSLVSEALRLAAVLAVPVALAALLAGLLSGLLQRVTAWSDATLTYVPRLAAVGLAWALTGSWVARALVDFTTRAWGGP
ncbi:flagellar biosynthetic protein FliQ [Myxococcota bacterium]|nr:flagellar biosynthetic protein FliQ [Myxococcota bacterium]